MHICFKIDLRQLWVGVYWDVNYFAMTSNGLVLAEGTPSEEMKAFARAEAHGQPYGIYRQIDIYICLLPLLPIHIGIAGGVIHNG